MTKVKTAIFPFLIVGLIVAVFCVSVLFSQTNAYAESIEAEDEIMQAVSDNETAEPYGLAKISFNMGGSNGIVWARAKNTFALGKSTVIVYVYLYSSDTPQSSYTSMTLASSAYIGDLNIGKTLETQASTGGVQKYWVARMRYKIDNKDWKEEVSPIGLRNANGELI